MTTPSVGTPAGQDARMDEALERARAAGWRSFDHIKDAMRGERFHAVADVLDILTRTPSPSAEPVAVGDAERVLWEALGLWSVTIAQGGVHAQLAPPQYLLDAVRSLAAHPAPSAQPDAVRQALEQCLGAMEMQEKRESGEFHIQMDTMICIWRDAQSAGRAALASSTAPPAAQPDAVRQEDAHLLNWLQSWDEGDITISPPGQHGGPRDHWLVGLDSGERPSGARGYRWSLERSATTLREAIALTAAALASSTAPPAAQPDAVRQALIRARRLIHSIDPGLTAVLNDIDAALASSTVALEGHE